MLGLDQTTWVDFETGDTHTERTIETHVYTEQSQSLAADIDPASGQHTSGF